MDDKTLRIILEAQDKASGVFGDIGQKLQNMGLISQNSAQKLSSLGDAATPAGEKLKTVGTIASVALAGGLAIFAAASIKAAGNFQQMTSTLVTTAGESVQNIDMIRTGILNLSTQTGTSASQMSTAMYTIESAGYHGAAGLTILKAAAQGAKTENADLQKVADAVTSAMRDYHEPASAAATVTSKLVAAVGQGKATFEEFSGALHSVLPLASAAHISLDDILGSMASMTVHGISAEQASQNLAEAIRTLMNPSQSAQQYLAQLGITASKLSDDLSSKGLSGTVQEISNAIMQHMGPSGKVLVDAFNQSKTAAADALTMLSKMPANLQTLAKEYLNGSISAKDWRTDTRNLSAEQTNLATQFASVANNAHGFNNLLKSGSPTALSYSQALQKATGNMTTMNVALMLTGENANYTNKAVLAVSKATAEAGNNVSGWSFIQKNFNQQMSEAKEGLHNATIAIGSAFLPIATALMKTIAGIVTPIAAWIEKHKTLAAIIIGSLAAFASLVAVILLSAGAIAKTTEAIKLLGGAFSFLKDIGAFNPWLLALMAIAAIAYEVITHWKQVSAFFEKFWSDVKQWTNDAVKPLKQVWNDIKDVATTVLQWISDRIQDVTGFLDKHKKGLEDIAIVLGVIVAPAFTAMAVQATIAAAKMVTSAVLAGAAWVTQAARASYAWVTQELPKIILGTGKAAATGALNAVKVGAAWILQAVKTTAAWALTFARFVAQMAIMVGQFLLQAARMAAGWLLAMGPIGLIVAVVAGVIALIVLNWNAFKKFFSQLWDDIATFVKAHWKIILDIILGPIGLIITNWSAITGFFGQLWDGIKGIFRTISGFIVNIFKFEWNGMVNIWNGVTGFFAGLWKDLKNGMSVVVGIIKEPFRLAFNAVADLWNGTVGKLSFKAPSWVPGIGGKGFDMPRLPHLAVGTSYFQGGMAMVGENGPELAIMPRGTQVIPNNKLPAIQQQPTTQNHFNINVNVGAYAGQPGEIDKLGEAIWQSFQRIARRHGMADVLPNIGVRPS